MRINRIEFVKELVRQDLTQTQLAEKAGVSRMTVNGIKNGRSCSDKSAIKIATLGKIAKALEVKPEEIIE